MSLADMKKGQKAVITAINAEKMLKKRLNSVGISKNSEVRVDEMSIGHNTIKVSLMDGDIALRLNEAEQIEVKGV